MFVGKRARLDRDLSEALDKKKQHTSFKRVSPNEIRKYTSVVVSGRIYATPVCLTGLVLISVLIIIIIFLVINNT